MTKKSHDPLTQVQQALDEGATDLSADRIRALRLARDRALNAAERRPRSAPLWLGAAAASVIALAILLRVGDRDVSPGVNAAPDSVIADLDVLTQEDDLGLIEDLEFLAWLSAQEEDVT